MAVPNPTKFCLCGCGGLTTIAPCSYKAGGMVKGQPMRYIFGHYRKNRPLKDSQRYRMLSTPRGQRAAHLVIAERALGKPLPIGAEVHHVDRNRHNNANTNLVICQDRSYHRLLHVRQKVYDAGGDPNTQRICHRCRSLVLMCDFYNNASHFEGIDHYCKHCRLAWDREKRQRRRPAKG